MMETWILKHGERGKCVCARTNGVGHACQSKSGAAGQATHSTRRQQSQCNKRRSQSRTLGLKLSIGPRAAAAAFLCEMNSSCSLNPRSVNCKQQQLSASSARVPTTMNQKSIDRLSNEIDLIKLPSRIDRFGQSTRKIHVPIAPTEFGIQCNRCLIAHTRGRQHQPTYHHPAYVPIPNQFID